MTSQNTVYVQLYHIINCSLPYVFIIIKYKAINTKYYECM